MKKELYIIRPTIGNKFDIELNECTQQLKDYVGDNIISLSMFIDSNSDIQFNERAEKIKEKISGIKLSQIPISIISQAPIENSIVIELLLSKESIDIERKKWQDINYSLIKNSCGTELIVSGITEKSISNNFLEIVESSFSKISSILELEGFNKEHIIRQWNYIENILELKSDNEKQFQRYQLFNEVRNSFYKGKRLTTGYPAATGIGMKYGGLVIDFIAWKSSGITEVYPINNPKQIASYQYGQEVLIGDDKDQKPKSPPRFERGKLICSNGSSTLYVSGTASILGEETIGYNDLKKQTITTINNINVILEESINKCKDVNRIKHIRVYLKSKKDFQLIKEICTKTYGEIPIIYVLADVCRDNLLIEIEAEYGI